MIRLSLTLAAIRGFSPLPAQTIQQLREATEAVDAFLDVVCVQRDRTTPMATRKAGGRLVGEMGLVGNHKRRYRLCTERGLPVRTRQRRKLPRRDRVAPQVPERSGQ